MVISETARIRMCDVCTSQESTEGWVETFVGEIPQSDLCIECAREVVSLLSPARPKAAPARVPVTA